MNFRQLLLACVAGVLVVIAICITVGYVVHDNNVRRDYCYTHSTSNCLDPSR